MKAGFLAIVAVLAGCASADTARSSFPRLPPGCSVQLFESTPTVPTVNIGTVHSECATDVSDEDCLRELKDQACRLGGNVVWGVPDKPTLRDGKNHWDGRVAHVR